MMSQDTCILHHAPQRASTCLALLSLIQAVFLALVVESHCLSHASPWNITPSLQVGMEETLDSVSVA